MRTISEKNARRLEKLGQFGEISLDQVLDRILSEVEMRRRVVPFMYENVVGIPVAVSAVKRKRQRSK